MNNLLPKSTLFYKYLLSYVIVLLIPLIILVVLVYNSFMRFLDTRIMETNIEMLTQVQTTIDMKMDELRKLSFQIASNPELTRGSISESISKRRNAINILRNYGFPSELIYEILLYYRGDSLMYSSSGTYTPISFISSVYRYKNWDYQEFINTINTLKTPLIKPADNVAVMNSNTEKIISYLVPIPQNNPVTSGVVIFMIKDSIIKRLLNDVVENYYGNVIILDHNENVLTSLNDEYINENNFHSIIRNYGSQTSTKITIENTEHFVTQVYSQATGWTYITVVPVPELITPLVNMRRKAFYSLILIAILGSFVIYYVMHINYTPIKKLKHFTEEKWGQLANCSNEITSVRQTVEHMSKTNQMLTRRFEDNKQAIKEALLLGLLRDHFKNIVEFNKRGSEIGITITKNYLLIALLYLSNSENKLRTNITEEIEKHLPGSIEGYGKSSIDSSLIIMIMATDINDITSLYHLFDKFHDSLKSHIPSQITIGVGNTYSSISNIGKSYLEAATAIDYRFIKGKDQIIFFNEVAAHQHNINYLSKVQLEQLELFILQGNTQRTTDIILEFVQKIKNSNIPLFTARSLCYNLINTIIKAIHRINQEHNDNTIKFPDVVSLTRFETVDELAELVQRISHDICNYIINNTERHNLINQYIKYIKANYDSYNFSIQNMADHFQISISSLSHYFKDQVGENVSEYVNSLKMEKAKYLLSTTDDRLQDIVTKLGYTNVSSFIRKFKQATEVTPGLYRELNRRDTPYTF